MNLSRWKCPHCHGALDLTSVDTSREFVCGRCGGKAEIEDEEKTPDELYQEKNRRRARRERSVLFVVTLLSGVMGFFMADQANEHLTRQGEVNKLAHCAVC